MRATPACTKARGCAGSTCPRTFRVPASRGLRPHSTSARACWPLPATPAIASTSPGCSRKSTSCSSGRAAVPRTSAPRSSHTAWPCGCAAAPALAAWRTAGATARPTIASARSCRLAPAAGRTATRRPARSTAMRCDTRSTSSSLWLMKMIDSPRATICASVAKSDSLSCGVSTAVGSSRIRMRAPRLRPKATSALRISTRWRSPTESSPTRASGSTARPKSRAACSSAARAWRRREKGCHRLSVPSITLSSTLRLSASVKCWCTMPMPAASAAPGWPAGRGWPCTSIVPASAT